ncbi:MAG: biotin--[acetyl-CoA-carboxylase] ligase [Bacteroidia bacterium]|nr:biotin--[acetyl-CoA-carboxylase] ligase [Bacteroidia bacterium]
MTHFVGKNKIHLTETTSTNQVATQLLGSGLAEGTVFTALYQSQGRGQQGSVWYSEYGKNVLFSVILYPTFLNLEEQFYLTMAMALALKETIKYFIPMSEIKIKWPNDILVQGKKMAGMLIENQIQGKQWQSSVVGIGINVNQEIFDPQIEYKATSCIIETRRKTELEDWYRVLCTQIEHYYLILMHSEYDSVKISYVQSLANYHEKKDYQVGGKIVQGIILGVDKQGKLAVQHENEVKYYQVKEIEWVFT